MKLACLLILTLLVTSCAEDVNQTYTTIHDIPPGTIEQIIDPCGDGPGVDEVLLFLFDGTILAWYNNIGLATLDDGNYVTTDNQRCRFSIVNGEYFE